MTVEEPSGRQCQDAGPTYRITYTQVIGLFTRSCKRLNVICFIRRQAVIWLRAIRLAHPYFSLVLWCCSKLSKRKRSNQTAGTKRQIYVGPPKQTKTENGPLWLSMWYCLWSLTKGAVLSQETESIWRRGEGGGGIPQQLRLTRNPKWSIQPRSSTFGVLLLLFLTPLPPIDFIWSRSLYAHGGKVKKRNRGVFGEPAAHVQHLHESICSTFHDRSTSVNDV